MSRIDFLRDLENRGVPDRHRIELAYIVAKGEHHWQRRDDGKRYFHDHCRGVAEILVREFGVEDPDLICAGLLHDIVEDTRYVTVDKVVAWFGWRVGAVVERLTKVEGQRAVEYMRQIAESRCAAIVKAADNLHNVRSLGGCTAAKRRYQLHRTETRIIPMLRDAACMPNDPIADDEACQHIGPSKMHVAIALLQSAVARWSGTDAEDEFTP